MTALLENRHVKVRLERLEFAHDHLNKDEKFFNDVIWSDETKIELFGHHRAQRIWQKTGETMNPNNTVFTISTAVDP